MDRIDRDLFKRMPDGTEKHINPFTGTEVWYIPGRGSRPIHTAAQQSAAPLTGNGSEDYCDFCSANYFNTTPEKARLQWMNGEFQYLEHLTPKDIFASTAEFRRIANLFEIVRLDYWKKNYDYHLTDKNRARKDAYLSSELGRNHIISMINLKLKYSGLDDKEIAAISVDEKFAMSDAFFGGTHELIIPRRHYRDDATQTNHLASSGSLSPEEHYQYFQFTIRAMLDMYENIRYVRYVSVFQNWLREAGASFDHLHTQLVGLDEWGVSVEREQERAAGNPNMYNEFAANFASYNNFVICENDHAIAFSDFGHRNPTVAVYSKSDRCRPNDHTPEELRGFSDIVHAIHAAMGQDISCNEEWYYMPPDSIVPMPWHVLIKWRVNISAGFEGGTKIYVNPLSVSQVRDFVVPRLFDLRTAGKLGNLLIAQECPVKPNSLKYYKFKPQ